MEKFLLNLPVNHWLSVSLVFCSFILTSYFMYFYFSKTGSDERGKNIIAKASLVGVIVNISVTVLATLLYRIATANFQAYTFILVFNWFVTMLVLDISIWILNEKI